MRNFADIVGAYEKIANAKKPVVKRQLYCATVFSETNITQQAYGLPPDSVPLHLVQRIMPPGKTPDYRWPGGGA